MRAGLTAALVTITFVNSGVILAATSTSEQNVLKGHEAFGGWQKDKPGVRRLLKPEDQPSVGESTSNPVQIVRRSKHARPIAPKGFSVDLIASGFAEPRVIRVVPNGDLFVADSEANTIRVFRVPTGRTRPVKSHIYASGLNKPFRIAFYPLGPNPQWVTSQTPMVLFASLIKTVISKPRENQRKLSRKFLRPITGRVISPGPIRRIRRE